MLDFSYQQYLVKSIKEQQGIDLTNPECMSKINISSVEQVDAIKQYYGTVTVNELSSNLMTEIEFSITDDYNKVNSVICETHTEYKTSLY